jgi:hypothetical protein
MKQAETKRANQTMLIGLHLNGTLHLNGFEANQLASCPTAHALSPPQEWLCLPQGSFFPCFKAFFKGQFSFVVVALCPFNFRLDHFGFAPHKPFPVGLLQVRSVSMLEASFSTSES